MRFLLHESVESTKSTTQLEFILNFSFMNVILLFFQPNFQILEARNESTKIIDNFKVQVFKDCKVYSLHLINPHPLTSTTTAINVY